MIEIEEKKDDIMPSITFMYHKYTSISQFVEALAKDWENGKRRLFSSALTRHFMKFNANLANHCRQAGNEAYYNKNLRDIAFFKCLYWLNPQRRSFSWKNTYFNTMKELGVSLLVDLRNNRVDNNAVYIDFMKNRLFSIREQCIAGSVENKVSTLQTIEQNFLQAYQENDEHQEFIYLYLLGYLYSGQKDLVMAEKTYTSLIQLIQDAKIKMKESDIVLNKFSDELIEDDEKNKLKPQFFAWLIVQGKSKVLENIQ